MAIRRRTSTRRSIAKGVDWKRECHQEHGTTLVETYSYLKREGLLESTVLEALRRSRGGACEAL